MNKNINLLKQEQILRGKRIKDIRENELRLNKTDLAKKLGITSQFLGLVEAGKSNLTYGCIRILRDLSGHSVDYILYGLDDSVIEQTKKLLKKYNEQELISALKILQDLSCSLIKKD